MSLIFVVLSIVLISNNDTVVTKLITVMQESSNITKEKTIREVFKSPNYLEEKTMGNGFLWVGVITDIWGALT